MNIDNILGYKLDPKEDYYAILGCNPSSTSEQIVAEFKIRARDCHPDKCSDPQTQERFQALLEAKEMLIDPKERSLYDAWRSAGIAVSYKQWRSLKDTVKSSMHWATPKTSGRMLDLEEPNGNNDTISLNPSTVKEKNPKEVQTCLDVSRRDDEDEDDEQEIISYDPTPYDNLGLRISTPPPDWLSADDSSSKPVLQTTSTDENLEEEDENKSVDPTTAMRRRQFATRRESTIGAMVMAEKWEDKEIRRRFRNYEI